jgi:hypothetical protein
MTSDYTRLKNALECKSDVYFKAYASGTLRNLLDGVNDEKSAVRTASFLWTYDHRLTENEAMWLCRNYQKANNSEKNAIARDIMVGLTEYYDTSRKIKQEEIDLNSLEQTIHMTDLQINSCERQYEEYAELESKTVFFGLKKRGLTKDEQRARVKVYNDWENARARRAELIKERTDYARAMAFQNSAEYGHELNVRKNRKPDIKVFKELYKPVFIDDKPVTIEYLKEMITEMKSEIEEVKTSGTVSQDLENRLDSLESTLLSEIRGIKLRGVASSGGHKEIAEQSEWADDEGESAF